MLKIKTFTFNAFQENTYVIWDDTLEAAIIDPGNSNSSENNTLKTFITEQKLQLKRLLLTHAHIDHVMGNRFIFEQYGLLPEVHQSDTYFIQTMSATAQLYGINCELSPNPEKFLTEGDVVTLGKTSFRCIHTPGHSPGSISFYFEKQKILFGGDVLFYGSIGRTDLPMGNFDTLINSIKSKLFVLGDDVRVYSGHGPSTTIGFEKENNPFLI